MVRLLVIEVIVNLIAESDTLSEVIESLSTCFSEDGNLYKVLQDLPSTEKVSGYKLA